MNKNFAETLKKLRAVKSISQRELAEKIFVTRSVIAKWENGYNLPNANVFGFTHPSEAIEFAQKK